VRLYKLQANVATQGVTNVTTRRAPGQDVWHDFPEVFDCALADVPCSMEGRFLLAKPKTWSSWSPKKIKELSQRQKTLLRSAVSATKPGGVIVYSTCTMAPEENEQVVAWLLAKEAGKVVLEDVAGPQVPGLPLSPGLTSWHQQEFPAEMTKTARIWPTPLMEGFFVAKFRKLTSTLF
jgi:16S rRNA (cytosine1407-C5)-methyltransferase